MAVTYEKIVAEDFDIGVGTVVRTMPGGGTANATQVHIGTFAEGGVPVADIGAAIEHLGQLRVVSDATVTTVGSVVIGGGGNRVLVFSNGTSWKIVMG